MYSDRKAAQIAAFFLQKKPRRRLPHLKLIKLMYLADRECLKRHGFPVSNDSLVSMPYGPVLSTTLNYINGAVRSTEDGWDQWISDRANHEVELLKEDTTREDLDELSDAELKILEATWERFGRLDQWELVEYTHANCGEWRDPGRSSLPIQYEEVLQAVGWSEEAAKDAADDLATRQTFDFKLANITNANKVAAG